MRHCAVVDICILATDGEHLVCLEILSTPYYCGVVSVLHSVFLEAVLSGVPALAAYAVFFLVVAFELALVVFAPTASTS